MVHSCLCNFSEVYPLGLTFRGLGLWNAWDYEVLYTVLAAERSWIIGAFRKATSHFSEFWATSTQVPLPPLLHSSLGLRVKQQRKDVTLETSSPPHPFPWVQWLLYFNILKLRKKAQFFHQGRFMFIMNGYISSGMLKYQYQASFLTQ